MSKGKNIGVFDSGFGGLSILRGIVKELPAYNYLYLGDTARTPYGSRSADTIYTFSTQAVDFLFAHNCELVIFACNTASSEALRRIQQEYLPARYPGKKVLGVLIPAAEVAAQDTTREKIGVIATESTVRSGAFLRELHKINPRLTIVQQACPLLVPLVEAGAHRSKAAGMILKHYLAPLKKRRINTLVLGCTHYGFFERAIKREMGPTVRIVSESRVVPKTLRDYLVRHPEIEKRLGTHGTRDFYSTDLTATFTKLGSRFFGKKILVKKATLA